MLFLNYYYYGIFAFTSDSTKGADKKNGLKIELQHSHGMCFTKFMIPFSVVFHVFFDSYNVYP